MVNMKISPKEKQEYLLAEPSAPEYPYGLCLSLDEESLAKLGLNEVAAGTEVTFTAKAVVKRASTHTSDEQEGVKRHVDLQITDMEIAGGQKPDTAQRMYGG